MISVVENVSGVLKGGRLAQLLSAVELAWVRGCGLRFMPCSLTLIHSVNQGPSDGLPLVAL